MDQRGAATDILFMSTRGGDSGYDRTFTQSFIRPGIGGEGWANRANYAALGSHQTGAAEMSIFLTQGRRYTLRLDGFASVNAPLEGGELITKPLKFEGNELTINYATSAAGRVLVEIQDMEGQPIPGFAVTECDPIYGDHISRVVTWNKGTDLSGLRDRAIQLRFVLSDADLFALKFESNPDAKEVPTGAELADLLEWRKAVDPNYATHPSMAFVKEDSALPRILLIGDSISMGYTLPVRKLLAGQANVLRIPANGGTSGKGIESLARWLGGKRWDVIHFNWGLHDCFQNTSIDEYRSNLQTLVTALEGTGAKLIWANSTPIPRDNPWKSEPGVETEYNKAAEEIMKEHGIAIDDLHGAIAGEFASHAIKPGDVHVRESGSLLLAKPVVAAINKRLAENE